MRYLLFKSFSLTIQTDLLNHKVTKKTKQFVIFFSKKLQTKLYELCDFVVQLKYYGSIIFTVCLLTLASCQESVETDDSKEEEKELTVEEQLAQRAGEIEAIPFSENIADSSVQLFTLKNRNGLKATITNYGGIITSLEVPDREGNAEDIVLGFDDLASYQKEHPYFGAIIGRYGNRIGKGQFQLDGKTYKLATNNGENHLHGGVKGFDKVVWDVIEQSNEDGASIKMKYVSEDMEEGYPGNLTMIVTYALTDNNTLAINYEMETDKKTICNPTNHTYFNLAGSGDILGHELMLKARQYTPVDEGLIPTGELANVGGTPFDFTTAKPIGQDIESDHEQIKIGGGYDHNWVLDRQGKGLEFVGSLYEPNSGRYMEVFTEEPGIQVYTGNFLDGTLTGKNGVKYSKRSALCLETQHYPDSPNQPDFPSVVLEPGKKYTTSTVYRFGVKMN